MASTECKKLASSQPDRKHAPARLHLGRRVLRSIRSWAPVIIAVLAIRAVVAEAMMVPTPSMESTVKVGDMLLVNKFIYGIRAPFTNRVVVPVSTPKRGDIVVFRCPADPDYPQPEANYVRFFPKWLPLFPIYWCKRDNPAFFGHRQGLVTYTPRNFVKRCVATAGDTVEVRNKRLYVNSQLVADTLVAHVRPEVYPASAHSRLQERWQNMGLAQDLSVRDNFGPIVVPEGCVMGMGDNRDNSWDSRFWGPIDLRYLRGKPMFIYMSYAFPVPAGATEYDYEVSPDARSILRALLNPFRVRLNRIGHIVA
jgi:signal peptidase I